MFNLLPLNLKNIIKSEYKMRRLTLILIFAVFVEGALLVFLFPTWLTSSYREKGILLQAQQMNNFLQDSNTNPATGVIKGINSKLNVINSALEYPKLLPYIDLVLSQKNNSILIDQFTYSSTASSTAELAIGGVSSTRESLVSFVKKLEETKSFKKVDLPISNLAKDKNIDFTINLTISP